MIAFFLFFIFTYLVFFTKPEDQAEGTRMASEEASVKIIS